MQPDRATAVVIPVKDFAVAKARLSAVLDPPDRARLAEDMATAVVRAAGSLPVHVVCDAEVVRAWAGALGVRTIWTPGLGLNGAVGSAVETLRTEGVERVIVAHSDLPHARDLGWVADFDGVTIVPDRHHGGTNVLCVPTGDGFTFAYGRGSFTRHREEALRLGLVTRIVRDAALGWDVDVPADLTIPPDLQEQT